MNVLDTNMQREKYFLRLYFGSHNHSLVAVFPQYVCVCITHINIYRFFFSFLILS